LVLYFCLSKFFSNFLSENNCNKILAKKTYIPVFLKVILQPAGFPFLILNEILKILDLIIVGFWEVINSNAINEKNNCLKSEFLQLKLTIIFCIFKILLVFFKISIFFFVLLKDLFIIILFTQTLEGI